MYRKLPISERGDTTEPMKTLERTTTDEARAVRLFRALANPARYRIVELLAARNECIVGDLVDELPLAQSSVSEHLKVLKEAGVVHGTVDGPTRCYCLDPEALAFLRDTFARLEGGVRC
jgi:ArsR family transcriptional regulator, arsenate/arsenite/antimonite-responsive transcriptional repressor